MANKKIFSHGIGPLFDDFISDMKRFELLTKNSADSYKSYINKFRPALDTDLNDWLTEALADSLLKTTKERVDYIMAKCTSSLKASNATSKDVSNGLSAIRKLILYILSRFDAALSMSIFLDDKTLAQFVAKTAIFATPETVEQIKAHKLGAKSNTMVAKNAPANVFASWDNEMSFRDNAGVRNNGKSFRDSTGILHDDNTTANYAIKKAILAGMGISTSHTNLFKGYEACHIYGMPNNPKYYTSIMNLVLIPSALAALSDSHDYVMDVLKYKAFELYGFVPSGYSNPAEPHGYNSLKWRS